jgi:hypothetical protein
VPVKPETTRGARRLVPRRRRARSQSDAVGLHGDAVELRGGAEADAFDPAEFAEFLEADDDGRLPADPAFRERLRQELWGMVRSQAERRRSAAQASVTPLPDPKRRR